MSTAVPKWFMPELAPPLPQSQTDQVPVKPITPAVEETLVQTGTVAAELVPAEIDTNEAWATTTARLEQVPPPSSEETLVTHVTTETVAVEKAELREARIAAEQEYLSSLESLATNLSSIFGAPPEAISDKTMELIDLHRRKEFLPRNPEEATELLNAIVIQSILEVVNSEDTHSEKVEPKAYEDGYHGRLNSINVEGFDTYPLTYQVMCLLPALTSYQVLTMPKDLVHDAMYRLVSEHQAEDISLIEIREKLLEARDAWNAKEEAIKKQERGEQIEENSKIAE